MILEYNLLFIYNLYKKTILKVPTRPICYLYHHLMLFNINLFTN